MGRLKDSLVLPAGMYRCAYCGEFLRSSGDFFKNSFPELTKVRWTTRLKAPRYGRRPYLRFCTQGHYLSWTYGCGW